MEREMSPADRLSDLPDEIRRLILIAADLDLKSLVQTSVLSSRWRSLWKTSLTKLHFRNIPLAVDEWNSFAEFVENVLSFRNPSEDLEALSLTTDGMLRPHMFHLLKKIFAHGVENRVKTFRFAVGLNWAFEPVPPGLTALCGSVENLELYLRADVLRQVLHYNNFSVLRTLRLYYCILVTLPMEAARCLQLTSEGFPNLETLELVGCDFRSIRPLKISGDKLVDLVIVCPKEPDYPFLTSMMICAPQLKSFTFKEIKLRLVKRLEVPSLEILDVDVSLCSDPSKRARKDVSFHVFRFFRRVASVKRVKLHPSTIKALTMVPGVLEKRESPFERMECVEFHNCDSFILNRGAFNALIRYFFDVDCIRGNALFDRIFAQQGESGDSSSRPVVVYKSDLN